MVLFGACRVRAASLCARELRWCLLLVVPEGSTAQSGQTGSFAGPAFVGVAPPQLLLLPLRSFAFYLLPRALEGYVDGGEDAVGTAGGHADEARQPLGVALWDVGHQRGVAAVGVVGCGRCFGWCGCFRADASPTVGKHNSPNMVI